jgi:hypothetical protein
VNYKGIADCIDRVLEINHRLADKDKIRVVSISIGFSLNDLGGKVLYDAIERAKKEDVFVITVETSINYDFESMGLGKSSLSNPDDINSYRAGSWWEEFAENYENIDSCNLLCVPMDSRTVAVPEMKIYYIHLLGE